MASKNQATSPVIKAWLQAMQKAGKIKPGGRLVFINKRTGSAVPIQQNPDNTLPTAPDGGAQ